jgi:hypothetical protein
MLPYIIRVSTKNEECRSKARANAVNYSRMEFFRFAALFFTGGIAGWVLELFFRRIVHHKWVNPGFLTGPLLPLYGFGLTALYYLTALPYDWAGPFWLQYVLKILFIGIAMTVVELIAGLIFIKGMKIKLWDYSDRWGNFQGIICPLFSLIWTAIGAGYVFLLHPLFVNYTNWIFNNPLPFLFGLWRLGWGPCDRYRLQLSTRGQDPEGRRRKEAGGGLGQDQGLVPTATPPLERTRPLDFRFLPPIRKSSGR